MALTRGKKLLQNTLFSVVVLLFFCLLLEVLARLFYPGSLAVGDRVELAEAANPIQAKERFGRLFKGCVLSYNTLIKDEQGLVLNRPGALGIMLRAAKTNYVFDRELDQDRLKEIQDRIEAQSTFQINQNGLRGPRVNDEQRRLLLLGDSITFGYYVNDDEVYGARLQHLLGATGHNYQVLNAGVSSYSAADELRYLEKYGLKLGPELVGIGFYLNDIFSLSKPLMVKEYNFLFPYRKIPSLGPFSRSRLVNLVLERLFTLKAFAGLAIDEQRPENISVENAWQDYRTLLQKMKDRADQNKIRLFLVIFPNSLQLSRPQTTSYYQQRLLQITRELEIPTLDLFDAFQKQGQSLYHQSDTIHPNALGHELAAQEIAEFLARKRLL